MAGGSPGGATGVARKTIAVVTFALSPAAFLVLGHIGLAHSSQVVG